MDFNQLFSALNLCTNISSNPHIESDVREESNKLIKKIISKIDRQIVEVPAIEKENN